jgi:hypothetical protein
MALKRSRWPVPDVESIVPDLQSPDEEARGQAVRGFCPCSAGWEAFESHVGEVLRAMRDPSRFVRAGAMHVFHDAAKMHREADLAYYEKEEGEERIGEKRAQRFRSMAERLEARRDNRARRRRRRHGRA